VTTSVTSGQVVTVTSGQLESGDLVEGGGTIQVFSNGTAIGDTLSGTSNGSNAELQQFPIDLNQDGFRGPGEALWH
jgi:hypothetical protein